MTVHHRALLLIASRFSDLISGAFRSVGRGCKALAYLGAADGEIDRLNRLLTTIDKGKLDVT